MTSYPCPYCRTEASSTTGCPGCGRGPDADAVEVVRLDAEISVLTARLTAARDAVTAADGALRRAWTRREAAASRVRAAVAAAARVAPRPAHAPAMTAPMTTATAEASTRLVQNSLFVLGGLLLAVAAIVFTAVAWSQFGVRGRAGLLAVVTVVALAAPLAALRRRLKATAETVAAVGLLLILLDGYAAWYVNLFGVADYSALGYAGAVCAVTAAVAAGYEHVTGLTTPRFAALLVAQPVLPLLVAPFHPGAAGWAYTWAAVAVVNLAVVHLRRGAMTPLAVAAYVLGGLAVAVSGICALAGLVLTDDPARVATAGTSLVAAAGVLLAAAVLARTATGWASAIVVVAVAIVAGRFAAVAGGERLSPVLIALVVAVLAGGVRLLPATVRRGPRLAALASLGVPAVVAVLATLVARVNGDADWRLPTMIVILAAGAAALLPWLPVTMVSVGLLTLAAPAALPWSPVVQSRVILGVAAVLVVAAYRIGRGFPAGVALAVLVTTPVWAQAAGDSAAVYAAAGLLLVALTAPMHRVLAGAAAAVLGLAFLAASAESLLLVLAGPWLHSGARWTADVPVANVVAMGILAVAAGIHARRNAFWAAAPVVALTAVLTTAAAGAPWPWTGAASLVAGLAGLLIAALRGDALRSAALAVVSAALLGAALAASPATDVTTLVAFGATLVAGVVIGAGGRAAAVRIAGWLGAAASAYVVAATAGRTAGLPLTGTAFVVLGAAAVVLATGVLLRRRTAEGWMLQAAAHGGAIVALLLTAGSPRYAAAVCTLWGVALGLRALIRDAAGRRTHVVAAAAAEVGGWWLLLAAEQVAVVEAYTIPAAAVAVLAGWLARRHRAGLSSWAAYGPALAAALLPTLASVLTGDGEPIRRLLLGVAALAVVVAGAHARLQAPVVAGGSVLILVALHEGILVWDLLPRWIPLAVAGLLLLGLATTLERRRRDVARLRSALHRMS
ncbi:SCO7613 C-terminal domain-containing membrane protein [Actinoplanes sp. NPDC049316]|uniref:SCO7613 C-terminal domain-containing membrane protein n=1 Tax=Actinoplanes sp. NPDC049316 TaxID=3154727 RepID=UPI00343E1F27